MDDGNQLVSLDDPEELSRGLRVSRILWAALAFAVVLYVAIGHLATQTRAPAPVDPVLVYALAGAAVAIAAAIPILRRAILPPRSEHAGGMAPTRRAARGVVNRFQSALMLSLALCEAIAILGLLLTFLSADLRYVLAFAAPSLVCMALVFPRTDALRSMLRAAAERTSD